MQRKLYTQLNISVYKTECHFGTHNVSHKGHKSLNGKFVSVTRVDFAQTVTYYCYRQHYCHKDCFSTITSCLKCMVNNFGSKKVW